METLPLACSLGLASKYKKEIITSRFLSFIRLSGGGHPGGRQYRGAGDVSTAPPGLPLHPVLCLQTLQGPEEEEEAAEEEGPEPVRLLHILAAPCVIRPEWEEPQGPQESRWGVKTTQKKKRLGIVFLAN